MTVENKGVTPDATYSACRRCGGKMAPGQAITQTLVGVPDFPGDDRPVTVSPGGTGRLADCMKCQACGWSVFV